MDAPDVIAGLAGISRGSALDRLRDRRPVAKAQSQRTFEALFEPEDATAMPVAERYAVAAFVAGLHGPSATSDFYAGRMAPEHRTAVLAAISAGAGRGPYGRFPAGQLTREDTEGPVFSAGAQAGELAGELGQRLAAALTHAHMLVFAPRDAAPGHLRALEAAGWSADGIVTLSQLVAFLSFQVRVADGLRHLGADLEQRQ